MTKRYFTSALLTAAAFALLPGTASASECDAIEQLLKAPRTASEGKATAEGAVAGAAIGAAVGVLTSDNDKKAGLIGGATGGLLGGVAGNLLGKGQKDTADKMDAARTQRLAVCRQREALQVTNKRLAADIVGLDTQIAVLKKRNQQGKLSTGERQDMLRRLIEKQQEAEQVVNVASAELTQQEEFYNKIKTKDAALKEERDALRVDLDKKKAELERAKEVLAKVMGLKDAWASL